MISKEYTFAIIIHTILAEETTAPSRVLACLGLPYVRGFRICVLVQESFVPI